MTLYTEFRKSALEYKNRPALYSKKNKKWNKITYRELLEKIDGLAEGLLSAGIKAKDNVAILAENCPEWLISDLALNKIGAVSVPIHKTSKKPLVEYVLDNSESGFLIITEELFNTYKNFYLRKNAIKKIILINRSEASENENEKLINFNDLLKNSTKQEIQTQTSIDDLASIIYTSGTTGEMKGVMLTNKNFIANIESAKKVIDVSQEDKLLSVLPLSHVLERTDGSYTALMKGASIAYAEDIKKFIDNLKEVKPTIIVCVPKLFQRIHENIFTEIKGKNLIIKNFFYWSLSRDKNSYSYKLADWLMFKKIRRIFGGRLRYAVSGGASIHERILRFFQKIGIDIIEGYGLTETSPLVSANQLSTNKIGTTGQIVPGTEVKIADDKEILIKGDNVTRGYWKKDEETRELFTADGWMKSGDLGFLDKENYLTIIGRKKEIIVLSNGKNVSPEKIESAINLSTSIEQSLVVGHKRDCLAALIVPNYQLLKNKFNIDISEIEKIKFIIKKKIDKANKRLEPHSQIRKFVFLERPFSVEENELTPTLKIKRKVIEDKYSRLIDSMYEKE
jgi:long-chain acyl-CoA synthetase